MYMNKSKFFTFLLLGLAAPLAGCMTDGEMFSDDKIVAYGGSKQHPIHVANGKAYVDPCGAWPDNLANTEDNHLNANHGCAVQSNIAAMAAYPDDLVGKRRKKPKPLGTTQFNALKKLGEGGATAGGTGTGAGGTGGGATAGGGAAP